MTRYATGTANASEQRRKWMAEERAIDQRRRALGLVVSGRPGVPAWLRRAVLEAVKAGRIPPAISCGRRLGSWWALEQFASRYRPALDHWSYWAKFHGRPCMVSEPYVDYGDKREQVLELARAIAADLQLQLFVPVETAWYPGRTITLIWVDPRGVEGASHDA